MKHCNYFGFSDFVRIKTHVAGFTRIYECSIKNNILPFSTGPLDVQSLLHTFIGPIKRRCLGKLKQMEKKFPDKNTMNYCTDDI